MIDRLISGLFRVYILLSILFILMPILTLVVFSFNINRHPRLPWSEFSFIWYEAMWNDPAMQSGFVNSLIVAACVAVIATFIGFCTAYLDYRFRFRGKIAILAIFFMPPTIPIVILGMVFLVYLAKIGLFGELHSVVIGPRRVLRAVCDGSGAHAPRADGREPGGSGVESGRKRMDHDQRDHHPVHPPGDRRRALPDDGGLVRRIHDRVVRVRPE